jgi:hypothetical protein
MFAYCDVGKLLFVSVKLLEKPSVDVGVLLNTTDEFELVLDARACEPDDTVARTVSQRLVPSHTPTVAEHCVEPPFATNVSELQLSVNGYTELGLLVPHTVESVPVTELSVTTEDEGFVTVADTLTMNNESIGGDRTACTT